MKTEIFKPAQPVYILSYASVTGKKEKKGPLGDLFDLSGDDRFGKETWEKAEAEMQRLAAGTAIRKSSFAPEDMDVMFAGDLINQCISSSYGLMSYGIPYLGIFGACSTCAEGMLMAAIYASSVCRRCISVTSSHYCTAERQFRYPLEYGGQRSPTSQWTVTGSGAFVYSSDSKDAERFTGDFVPMIEEVMPGCMIDRGISDANNMGAAMAPSAADTLSRYFSKEHTPEEFDLIVTGDLGSEGTAILRDLMLTNGYDISKNHVDCGNMIFSPFESDTHAGGSGCGCSAVVMAADILPNIASGKLTDILFLGTGALMNALAVNQKQTIPGIAHLVRIKGVNKINIKAENGE